MSPANLKNLAANTRAIAGIEFEMITRGYAIENNNKQLSEPVSNFRDIEEFFWEFVSSRTIDRVITQLENRYDRWVKDQISSYLDSHGGYKWLIDWFKNNVTPEEIADEMNLSSTDEVSYYEAAEYAMDNNLSWYEDAYNDLLQEKTNNEYSQSNFLQSERLYTYEDVLAEFSILEYPANENLEESYSNISADLTRVLGKTVNWATTYHGGERDADTYTLEPDSSITVKNEKSDVAVEIISHPMPIAQMIADYKKIRSWAIMNNHYTNSSTGLHINISIPGFDFDKVDYLKLVLLSGDEHVLKQFGRLGNSYARNALASIRKQIENEANIDSLLANLNANFEGPIRQLAEKVMFGHRSVSVKHNRIEFRSPGGDWLNQDESLIENTVYRYVVALDAAMHPEKFREDYLKKLYQLLDVKDEVTIGLFKFYSNMLSKEKFKQMVKNAYKTKMNVTAPTTLTELFERPLEHAPFIQWNNNEVSWFYVDDMTYVFMAQHNYGNIYLINFKMIPGQPDEEIMQTDPYGEAAWDAIYNKMYQSETKVTGTGHQNQVIGTIMEIFKDFVAKKQPTTIQFVAFASSRGRMLLYRRLALLAVKYLGFQFDEEDLSGIGKLWTLTKR
jgi:hypothetical protein